MDIAGVLLKLILQNPADSLEVWSKLKLCYFNSTYLGIYTNVSKFYTEHSKIPSFIELETKIREPSNRASLVALDKLEIPDELDIHILYEALVDEYTQNQTLDKLSEFLDNINLLSSEEIKDNIANILLFLEEKTHSSENVFLMSDFCSLGEDDLGDRIPLGINSSLDYHSGGFMSTDLLMIGGPRGSGKSVVACNISCNQFKEGNVGLFFSIEMPGIEIYHRNLAILSGVEHDKIRNNRLEFSDYDKLARTRITFFEDAESVYENFLEHKDFNKFDRELVTSKKLKEDNQIIIIDNQGLTIADIDLQMHKTKAQFGDKFKVCVVDYVNQIVIPEAIMSDGQYDWKSQIVLSKQLKDLARKHNVCVVTPYQIDAKGEARFSKGLLDAADVAFTLEANDDYIKFKTTKSRSFSGLEFNSKMSWDTLTVHEEEFEIEDITPETKEDDLGF